MRVTDINLEQGTRSRPIVSRRAATSAETEFARQIHHAAYRDAVLRQFGAWDETRQDEFFAAAWNMTPHQIILADGVPVGYCAVEERPDDIHVRELVIRPEAQSQGIGTELLRQVQAVARRRALPIRLGTFHTNRAQDLYARLGFRRVGQSATHVFLEWSPTLEPKDRNRQPN